MVKKLKNWKIPHYIGRIMDLLPTRRKKQFYLLLAGMVSVAVLETASLGVLSIFATTLSSPEEIMGSDAYAKVTQFLGVSRAFTVEQFVLILSVAVVIAVIIKNTATAFIRYFVARFAAAAQGHTGEVILGKFLGVEYEWHLKQNPHDLLITLNWRGNVGLFISSALNIVSNTILVLIMMVSIIVVQPVLMPFMIVVLGTASFYIYKIIRKRIDRNAKEVYKYAQRSTLDGARTIHGMKDVRIFGLENQFLGEYAGSVFKLARFQGFQNVLTNMPTWIMEAVGFFFLSSAIVIMMYVMKLGRVEIFGTLSLLAVAAWRVLPAINKIISGISTLRVNYPFIDRIYNVLDDIDVYGPDEVALPARKPVGDESEKVAVSFRDSLRFDNVSFRYGVSENYAIRNLTCEIRKGTSVGIVGHSGAGKSTFVDLFIGLLKPTSGCVLLNGAECDESQLRAWRRIIGYVPQFPYIYDCSLAENVAFGERLDEIDRTKVEDVCRKASIDFLDELEDGIYSRIGEHGLMISGGQKQRVAIARALYNQPEVLVFDEATSSLDTRSEKSIQRTIDSFKGEQTMLIIAHRLTTVEKCDYLIWLEHGNVVKIGTPAEVLPEYVKHQDTDDDSGNGEKSNGL